MRLKRIRRSSKLSKILIVKIATNRQSLVLRKRKSKLDRHRLLKVQKKLVIEISLLLWDQSPIYLKENVRLESHRSYLVIEIQ